ncbi:hypothetical protein HDU99_002720 [Rhizoclosmatium hyalinum]|nr:hypothetical protein HDU99_002720 [Rhizoclosmatium hyalinum]
MYFFVDRGHFDLGGGGGIAGRSAEDAAAKDNSTGESNEDKEEEKDAARTEQNDSKADRDGSCPNPVGKVKVRNGLRDGVHCLDSLLIYNSSCPPGTSQTAGVCTFIAYSHLDGSETEMILFSAPHSKATSTDR